MRAFAFLFSALFLCCPVSATPFFAVTDLGTLGGSQSTAYGISSEGVTVGAARPAGDADVAVVSSAGTFSALSAPGAIRSQANGINSSGQVAGTVQTPSGAQATVWSGGLISSLGTLGGSDSYGLGINDAGNVAGSASLANGDAHAFLFQSGIMKDLGTLGSGSWSAAYGINNANQVTGYSMTAAGGLRAFRWDEISGMADLGTLGGNSYGMGVNDSGQVTGASATPAGYLHAFFWTGGSMQDLGTLGGTSSYAYGINGLGDVVGCSFTADSENTHAFLWLGGGLFDLNGLIAANSGWVLKEAYGINDGGQIVGMGTYQGQLRAFRLDPEVRVQLSALGQASIPEPGMLTLLGIGLVLMWTGVGGTYRKQP